MAEDIPEVWESTFQGQRGYGAVGPRDVLIIVSSESLEGPDIVPRKKGELTQEDNERLSSEDIPPESWQDDAKLMEARYQRGKKNYTVVSTESNPKSVSYVMGRITALFNNTRKPGVVIHYIGPGRRSTGDWCFNDGFITFQDIMTCYNQHFTGKFIALLCDCSYSGKWIEFVMKYQDENRIQPCGHSARATNKLLYVAASCGSEEIPHSLYFSARGCRNDKNTGTFYLMDHGYKVAENQRFDYCNNTRLTCKAANFEVPCLLPDHYTWQNLKVAERLFLVRNTDLTWWGFFLVIDDDNIMDQIRKGQAEISDYGELIQSGEGRDPPEEIKEWIDNEYTGHKCY